jgi:tetratricopeptide (TPR) repeat protein
VLLFTRQHAKANEARKKCITNEQPVTEADNKHTKMLKEGKWEILALLKARILNDGGFNNEAIQVLQGKSNSSFKDVGEQLEFNYSVGRINDDLKKYDDAIAFYIKAIAYWRKQNRILCSKSCFTNRHHTRKKRR